MVMEEEQSHMELASESVPVPQVMNSNELRNNDCNNEIATLKKKPRLRKKALHAAIRKQMEFYFGDANLSKDRFLGNLIKQDPYVDLQVFLGFNKIRNLTTDINQIVRALQKSEILSVSEDGSRVCRVTPISQKENIDECTIYVQRLPLNVDHEWLNNVFGQYGTVSYVSIPRYKSNKRIKGFAFVEFEDPKSAVKCLEGFRKKGCVLPSQTSPDSLMSITTFHEEEMMEKQRREQQQQQQGGKTTSIHCEGEFEKAKDTKLGFQTEEKSNAMETVEENEEIKTAKKRKHKESEQVSDTNTDHAEAEDEKKRRKLKPEHIENEIAESSQSNENSGTEKKDDSEIAPKSNKRKASVDSKEVGNESSSKSSNKQNEDDIDSEIDKKSKKRKQRSSSTTKQKEISNSVEEEQITEAEADDNVENKKEEEVPKDGEEEQKKKRNRKRHNRAEKVDTADIGMQIMAKRDWKTLRNKYLELQRSKMKSLKAHLKRARWNQWNNYEKFRESDKATVAKNEVNKEIVTDDQKSEKSTQRFIFTPGVIVRVEMDEPCTDPKSFKMELKRNSNIKYIDVGEGATEGFIRCDTNEAAKALVLQSNEERSMSILQDYEETEYWNKMSRDREEKLGKKIRVKQRGRDKLLKKAEKELGKHIKFDEV